MVQKVLFLTFGLFSLLTMTNEKLIFQFSQASKLENWKIVDDVVMGGVSNGNIEITKEGHGKFYGSVSTENNGGFSSVRYRFGKVQLDSAKYFCLYLKGDSKRYQMRLKDKQRNYYSYMHYFNTTDSWQTVRLKLTDFYPTFRGMKLKQPNFQSDAIEELAFLISNKKSENFSLLIDRIYLE
jgi:hypothetical protein